MQFKVITLNDIYYQLDTHYPEFRLLIPRVDLKQ